MNNNSNWFVLKKWTYALYNKLSQGDGKAEKDEGSGMSRHVLAEKAILTKDV